MFSQGGTWKRTLYASPVGGRPDQGENSGCLRRWAKKGERDIPRILKECGFTFWGNAEEGREGSLPPLTSVPDLIQACNYSILQGVQHVHRKVKPSNFNRDGLRNQISDTSPHVKIKV